MKNLIDAEMDALIKRKIYKNKKELLTDSVRTLLETRYDLRLESAIELYRRGEISLAKAAEITGISLEGFKAALAERGAPRTVEPPSDEEMSEEVNLILEK